MKAIHQRDPDDPRSLILDDAPTPTLREGEVLLKITAAGVNRGDLMQTKGMYPPPPGASEVLGLEAAGTIIDPGTTGRTPGELAGALLAGGGYAHYAAVPEGQLTPIPRGWTLAETASIVEVATTVWSNLGMIAGLRHNAGQRVLIHGGSGGIGSFAIQLAKAFGAEVATTAGSAEKLDYCTALGADIRINYREERFVDKLKGTCDIILDIVGGPYLEDNQRCLAKDGHLCVIALQGGAKGELSLGRMLTRRQHIHATTIRARSLEDKARIVASTVKHVWPLLDSGAIRPQIHRTLSLTDAAQAHDLLDTGTVTGKLVLLA